MTPEQPTSSIDTQSPHSFHGVRPCLSWDPYSRARAEGTTKTLFSLLATVVVLCSLAPPVSASRVSAVPFHAQALAVPGLISLSDYDRGGPHVAFQAPAVTGRHLYRTDDAGVQRCADPASTGNGFMVANSVHGNWLRYTINVGESGAYTVSFRVSSQTGGTLHLATADGQSLTGPVLVPPTGDDTIFATVTDRVRLSKGIQTVVVCEDGGRYSLEYMSFCADFKSVAPVGASIRIQCPDGHVASCGLDCTSSCRTQPVDADFSMSPGGVTVRLASIDQPEVAARPESTVRLAVFRIVAAGGGLIALQATDGRFVEVTHDGGRLALGGTSLTRPAEFRWVPLGDNAFALLSGVNGLYVTAVDQGHTLAATSVGLGVNQTFGYTLP